MSKNIVHQYFKRERPGEKVLIKANPLALTATELIVSGKSGRKLRELELGVAFSDELKSTGFDEVHALEFNLYLSGLL